ncbi:hypothetical protein CC78DRAFT_7278 [Lojkania enalia]|uniref:Uncharacterized protein n=1 Tax=Lojkania enalia TaxID=147567 RepID=A0A9P4TS00_9PLEO|nr:hypothetical protein CC78DRAFT_7278 [Didymosphaeria enalia]
MSGPYRFTNDNTRSPLDRQPPNVFQAGQPPSFKTNVNRAKTKKWVEAKPYSYDGDDWGEYDEYDEYGADQPPPPPPNPSVPTGLRQPGQRVAEPSRSFTDPQRQPSPSVPGRRNSFEAGDEYRTFSATTSQASGYGQPGYAAVPQDHVRSSRQPSAAESHVSDTPQHRRDFSPSALPPPLNTRPSPAPGNTTDSSASATFPPRKSSVGQGDTPITNPASLRDRASSNSGKSLPFVRPADIYKRVEEERQRERASLDSSRPSLDSLASRSKDDSVTLQGGDIEKSLRSLETVAERKSEYLTDVNSAEQEKPRPDASDEGPKASQQPSLPQVEGISAFDNDFWSGGPQAQKAPALFSPEDNGLRSVVNQAFTRSDDQRSVPATPISKDSESGVSRSNTDSTSGISPIMSRVPSSATSALRSRNAAGETSTPAIAEETSENSTPVSGPVSGAMLSSDPYQVPRKPSPGHSRDISNPSLPRGGLSTPSPGESPARSPAIEPQKPVPEPESALLGSRSPTSSDNIEDRSGGPSSTYASREADIATAMRISPDNAVPELGAAEKESQNAFLDSHQNAQSPLPSAVPHSRSESPSKGRVQELVGKFGEVSHSRRGSTQSNASRTSVQSWEQSQDNSRPSSLTKAGTSRSGSPTKESSTQRPLAEREASFRPKLPGQWESYATAATPSEHGDREIQSIVENEPAAQGRLGSSPLGEVDLTPTTAKHPMSAIEPMDSSTDPLAALKAAGTAVGEAIQASSGLGLFKQVPPNEHDEQERNRTIGNINLARPVQLERTTSSVASSIPPTPPAKDTPDSEGLPPPPPLKDLSPELNSPNDQAQTLTQPTIAAQLSTEASADGQESARLRKEIVTSLSPQKSVEISNAQSERASLQPTVPDITNRESSILPSEYDSYWADGGHTSFHQSNDLDQNNSEHSPVETKPVNHPSTDLGKPSLLSRFSWEDNIPHTISHQQTRAGANESPKETPVEENKVLVTSQLNVNSPPSETFAGIPDPYFGPVHIAAVTKPDPVKDSDFTARSPSPVLDSAKSASDLTQVETIREASPASGLHVVNSDLNPEAVDIPPRLSAEVLPQSQLPQASEEKRVKLLQEEGAEQPPNVIPVPASTVEPPVAQETAPKSPTSDKPLGFREIVTLSSSSERIATYNKTRDYWAHTDHGLNDWMVSAMAANPELASQPIPQQQPQITTSGTFRHKHTGSLSLFGKHHHGLSGQPSNDQSAVVQTPTTPTSSGAAVALGSSAGGGRSASHQMQVKGKDLLHTAEILGGKGMKGAKGLFAKGKSRFRASGSGDKVDK